MQDHQVVLGLDVAKGIREKVTPKCFPERRLASALLTHEHASVVMLAARLINPAHCCDQGAFDHVVVERGLRMVSVLRPEIGSCKAIDVGRSVDSVSAVFEIGLDRVVFVFACDFNDAVDGNFL